MDRNTAVMTSEDLVSSEDSGIAQYLTFSLADEEYGIDISHITEIIGLQEITQLPESPVHVRGVISLREQTIPVIDMRDRFHLDRREYDERTCIIIVRLDQSVIGLIVDRVREVVDINVSQIEPPPELGQSWKNEYIHGIGRVEGKVKILLDVRLVFNKEDLDEILTSEEA
jgi:purine-binding chemotaxis protein CheW